MGGGGGSGNSLTVKAAGGWVQQPAGPAGQGGEDAEEGAGKRWMMEVEVRCLAIEAAWTRKQSGWRWRGLFLL